MRERAETLRSGTRLGPYEIVSLLGSGGMGEVYRARDPRLGREVALKVLPGDPDGSDRLRRFQTEAKAAAALSHPNIVAVHDVGEHDGVAYIVSELVPGGTLAALLDRGALPVKRLSDIAVALADALAAAHASGIVHRDLKPENVLMAKDGSPKIADFGLAKYLAPVPAGGDTAGTTLEGEQTREGVVFGTVGYMSPEQAQGKPLDFRSDQFSFGSVLYEMATGTRAFRRDSAVDTLAAILHEEPKPIEIENPAVPAPLRWTIGRCLAKDPDRRYASTADLARELNTIREHLGETTGGMAATDSPPRRRLVRAAAAALLLGAALLAGRFLWRSSVPMLPSFQQLTFRRGTLLHSRYTPDGGSIVYAAAWEGNPPEIYTARLDGTESRPFGIQNADLLSVSSKGDLAVLLKKSNLRVMQGRGTLAVVPLAGGVPRELLEDVDQADWSPDGTQLAVSRIKGMENVIEYPIGRVLYTTTKHLGWMMRVSPDGRSVAFVETTAFDSFDLKLVDVNGKTTTLLHLSGYEALTGLAWAQTGREILLGVLREGPRGDTGRIVAVDMMGRTRDLFGGPAGYIVHDLRPDGSLLINQSIGSIDLIFASASEPGGRNLGWLTNSVFDDMSEDGRAVLFHDNTSTYLRGTDGSPPVRVTNGVYGTLSPDRRFVVLRTSEHEIGIVPIRAGQSRTVSVGELIVAPHPRILSDGKTIVLGAHAADGKGRIYVTDTAGAAPRAISGPIDDLGWTVTSPDEREVAACDAVNGLQIFRLDGAPPRKIEGLDPDDGVFAWSADGKFLYVDRDGDIPVRIERFDLATAKKEPWRVLTPPDLTGVYWAGAPSISRDGRFWAFQANRNTSEELWQITGLPIR